MGQNTKCPLHGNDHPDFLCPNKERLATANRVVQIMDCKLHGPVHANCMCPKRDPLECAREMLGFVLKKKEDVDAWFLRPHPAFDGKIPQYYIDGGRADVVFDLVCDMITGNPD